jgi:hypothetical protein
MGRIKMGKTNWISHVLGRNCLLEHVTEGKIETIIYEWREDKEKDVSSHCYWGCNLKQEGLDRTVWRTRFRTVYEPVLGHTTVWMNGNYNNNIWQVIDKRVRTEIFVTTWRVLLLLSEKQKVLQMRTLAYNALTVVDNWQGVVPKTGYIYIYTHIYISSSLAKQPTIIISNTRLDVSRVFQCTNFGRQSREKESTWKTSTWLEE